MGNAYENIAILQKKQGWLLKAILKIRSEENKPYDEGWIKI